MKNAAQLEKHGADFSTTERKRNSEWAVMEERHYDAVHFHAEGGGLNEMKPY